MTILWEFDEKHPKQVSAHAYLTLGRANLIRVLVHLDTNLSGSGLLLLSAHSQSELHAVRDHL